MNLTYQKAKAGLTWEYLQFSHNETKKLFLIKNAAYFNEKTFSQAILPNKDKSPRRTYLHELSKINLNLDFPNSSTSNVDVSEDNVQLSWIVIENQIKKNSKK